MPGSKLKGVLSLCSVLLAGDLWIRDLTFEKAGRILTINNVPFKGQYFG